MKQYTISIEHDSDPEPTIKQLQSFSDSDAVDAINPDGDFIQIIADMSEDAADAIEQRNEVRYVLEDAEGVGVLGSIVPPSEVRSMSEEPSWGYFRIGAGVAKGITGLTGEGADVAVLDTGIYGAHPDLSPNIGTGRAGVECGTQANGYPCSNNPQCPRVWFDDGGHGTWCAGAIAAPDNEEGVAGVAPGATIHAYKGLDCRGTGRYSHIASLLTQAADQGHDVVSMSLGGPPSPIMKDAVDYAANAGCVIVAAAGNSGGDIGAPAMYDATIAVGATDSDDNVAEFSCRGPELDLVAPGVRLRSTMPKGYGLMTGTSMAAPQVAGAAALLVEAGVTKPKDVREILRDTAHDIGTDVDLQGGGLLAADEAAEVAADREPEQPPTPPGNGDGGDESPGGPPESPGDGSPDDPRGPPENIPPKLPDDHPGKGKLDEAYHDVFGDDPESGWVDASKHMPESEFEDRLVEWYRSRFGHESVTAQYHYSDDRSDADMDRFADIVIETGPDGSGWAIEVENDFEACFKGVGQTVVYAGGFGDNMSPMVVVPEGHVEEPEVTFMREVVPVVEFPSNSEDA